MKQMKLAALCAASFTCLAATMPAMAQDAQAPAAADQTTKDADIVVTAQKRVERVQDVPLSITVASQQALERQQVNTVADLSRIAPSLEIQQAPGQSVGGGGQIRGIGTQSFQQGAVGSVGIVVDQVSQGNVNISDLFDVARVEVLKGPQGTLFGLTTSAGVINIVTNQPEFGVFSARARTELSKAGTAGSEYGQQIVQGLVNVPIADNAALRVSGNVNWRQGVDRNTLDGTLDTNRSWGLRGRFLWEPTANLTVNLIGDYTKVDNSGHDFFTIFKATPALATELARCGVVAGAGSRDYCTSYSSPEHSKTYGASAQVDFDAGPFTLTSITALRKQDTGPSTLDIIRFDVDPLKIIQGPTTGKSRLVTQEFRVSSPNGSMVEYTAGAFFSTQKTLNPPGPFNVYVTLPFPPFPVINPTSSLGNQTNIYDDSLAVFGQARAKFGDHFRVIAGARYTGERLGVDSTPVASGVTARGATNIKNFSYKLGLQYEFTRNLMTYATYSRGYKGPQLVLPDPSLPNGTVTNIRPEVPTNYEAGFKGTFAGGRLVTDLNVFAIDLKDYQGQICSVLAGGLGLRCIPQNISVVKSKGIEFNIFGRPFDGLSLNVGAIYNTVEYPGGFPANDLYGGPGAPAGGGLGTSPVDLGGEQLANAPKWKLSASGEYSAPLGGSIEGFLAADIVYKDGFRTAASIDPNLSYHDAATVGGRIGLRDATGHWTAAVFVRNLTNNHEPVIRLSAFPANFGDYGQILTPQSFRQVGISLDGRF